MNDLVDGVLSEEERDILQQQGLTAEGRFPCRFPGCSKSFISIMAKQEGIMNCRMNHLFRLTMTP